MRSKTKAVHYEAPIGSQSTSVVFCCLLSRNWYISLLLDYIVDIEQSSCLTGHLLLGFGLSHIINNLTSHYLLR